MQRNQDLSSAQSPEQSAPPPLPSTPPPLNPAQEQQLKLNNLGRRLRDFLKQEKILVSMMQNIIPALQEIIDTTPDGDPCKILQLNHFAHIHRLSTVSNTFQDLDQIDETLSIKQFSDYINLLNAGMTDPGKNEIFKEHLSSCAWFTVHGASLIGKKGPWFDLSPQLAKHFQYGIQCITFFEELKKQLVYFSDFPSLNLSVLDRKEIIEINQKVNKLHLRMGLIATFVNQLMTELAQASNYNNGDFASGSVMHDKLFHSINALTAFIMEEQIISSYEIKNYTSTLRQHIIRELTSIGIIFATPEPAKIAEPEVKESEEFYEAIVNKLNETETRRSSDKINLLESLHSIMIERDMEDKVKIEKMKEVICKASTSIRENMRYHFWQSTDGRLQDTLVKFIDNYVNRANIADNCKNGECRLG